ncbi:MAG: FAD/NAD(P)-binding protein [Pirellulales bacterium]
MNLPRSTAITENPWLAQPVTIAQIVPEISGVATYRLRFREPATHLGYAFRPGQFNMLYLPGVGEIAISCSAASRDLGTWDHTIRAVGSVTGKLATFREGESLGLRGPYGTHWPLEECAAADVIVVAGGIGLAPLRPAIYALLDAGQRYGRKTLLYGTRTPDALLYDREYDVWSAGGFDVQVTVDRSAPGWTGNVGVVPLLVDRLSPWSPANCVLFVCGPEVMMRYTVRSALARGLRKDQIWLSLERNMQCAVGFCGHCQLGPTFVCKDGPIFRYDVIEPFFSVEAL